MEIATVDFSLFDRSMNSGVATFSFAHEFLGEKSLQCYPPTSLSGPIVARSILIRRAEAGAIIELYADINDTEPGVSISFARDIHEPVPMDLDVEGRFENVLVQISNPMPDGKVGKVSLSMHHPEFINFLLA